MAANPKREVPTIVKLANAIKRDENITHSKIPTVKEVTKMRDRQLVMEYLSHNYDPKKIPYTVEKYCHTHKVPPTRFRKVLKEVTGTGLRNASASSNNISSYNEQRTGILLKAAEGLTLSESEEMLHQKYKEAHEKRLKTANNKKHVIQSASQSEVNQDRIRRLTGKNKKQSGGGISNQDEPEIKLSDEEQKLFDQVLPGINGRKYN